MIGRLTASPTQGSRLTASPTQGSVKDGWDQEQDKEPPKQSRWIDKAGFRYTHTKHFYTWCHSKQVIYQKQLKFAVNDAFGSNLWPCHDSLC